MQVVTYKLYCNVLELAVKENFPCPGTARILHSGGLQYCARLTATESGIPVYYDFSATKPDLVG
jgi:hypothetical protein